MIEHHAITPVLWPAGLGRADSCGFDLQVQKTWRYVPETVDDMWEWASIGSDDVDDPQGQRDKRYLLYHMNMLPDEYSGVDCQVTIVLQGVLGKHQLSTLGNWKG